MSSKSTARELSIGVIASVLATALVTLAPLVRNGTMPLWIGILLALLFCATAGQLWRQTRGNTGTRRRVFLSMPAFQQKHWFAAFLQELLIILDRSHIDLVVKTPSSEFSPEDQRNYLRAIRSRRVDFNGGFIIPISPSTSGAELRSFCRDFERPVVFVDVRPFESVADYPPNSAFVGSDNAEIGRVAAHCLSNNYLGSRSGPVIVIGSTSQSMRQESFEKEIGRLRPTNRIVRRDDGNFDRNRARHIAAEELRQSLADSTSKLLPAAFFCTNDEMALGAVDALLESPHKGVASIPIIGVDGTPEARAVIDSNGTPFVATLAQDARRVAAAAWTILQDKMAGETTATETIMPIEIYPLQLRTLSPSATEEGRPSRNT